MIMPPRTNAFECTSCFSSWKIDPYCRVTPLDEEGRPTGDSAPLYEIYRRIKAMPLRAISSHLLPLTPGEELYLMSRPHALLREGRFPHTMTWQGEHDQANLAGLNEWASVMLM